MTISVDTLPYLGDRTQIRELISSKIDLAATAGKDGISGAHFLKHREEHEKYLLKMIRNWDHRFRPYLEILASKGKGKPPRVISKPSLIDKAALSLANQ